MNDKEKTWVAVGVGIVVAGLAFFLGDNLGYRVGHLEGYKAGLADHRDVTQKLRPQGKPVQVLDPNKPREPFFVRPPRMRILPDGRMTGCSTSTWSFRLYREPDGQILIMAEREPRITPIKGQGMDDVEFQRGLAALQTWLDRIQRKCD